MSHAPAPVDGRAHFDGTLIRIPRPMDVGTFTDCRKMATADLAKFLDVPADTLAADGAGRVSYVARNNVLTSEYRDRYRDVVRANGGNFVQFLENPGPRHGMLQLQHGFTTAPHPSIGRVSNLAKGTSKSGLPAIVGDFEFHSSTLALEIAQLMEGRFLRAGSIGFAPNGPGSVRIIDAEGNPVPNADPADYGFGGLPEGWGYCFDSWSLLEHSIVTVPANPEALGKSASDVRRAFLEMPETCKVMGIDRPRMVSVPPMGSATFHKAACPGGHCPGCMGEMAEPMPEPDKALRPGDSASATVTLEESKTAKAADANGVVINGLHGLLGTLDNAYQSMTALATDSAKSAPVIGTIDATAIGIGGSYVVGRRSDDQGPEIIKFSPNIGIAEAARVLKETSLETCPECLGSIAYYHPAKSFVTHRNGERACIGKILPTAPSGPRVKEVIKAGKAIRRENVNKLERSIALAEESIALKREVLDSNRKEIAADDATSAEPATVSEPVKAAALADTAREEVPAEAQAPDVNAQIAALTARLMAEAATLV